jgi:cytidylate kinase
MIPVITLDGSSGVGKGTISLLLAQKLGWNILDSGAIYRILAYAINEQNIKLNDENTITKIADKLDIIFKPIDDKIITILNGYEISTAIRQEKIGSIASKIAVFPKVRASLLKRQRAFCKLPGLIADGRDMGTIVFPNAHIKFFLIANHVERAKRRYKQLKKQGINVNLTKITEDLAERDQRDMNRKTAPLKAANDAIIIDTSQISIDDVLKLVFSKIAELY